MELVSRCQLFVKSMYVIMLRGVDEEMRSELSSKAAMWVIQFSWDVMSGLEPTILQSQR